MRRLTILAALVLAFTTQACAQSSGEVVLTGLAVETRTTGQLVTYRFADGGTRYFVLDGPWQPGSASFKDSSGVLYEDPAQGDLSGHYGVKEQGGVFFIHPSFKPGASGPSRASIMTPYNYANTPNKRLVYDLTRTGPGRYDADSEGVPQDW